MCCFYHTSNTINLVTAMKYTTFGVIEYCVFVKDLIDCSATTHGIIFAKYVAQITKQQGRYAVGHRVLRSDRRPRATRPWAKWQRRSRLPEELQRGHREHRGCRLDRRL